MPYGRKEIIRTGKSGTDFTDDSFHTEKSGSGQWQPVSLLGLFYYRPSVLLFLLVYYTGDSRWNFGWFTMFLFWGFMLWEQRRQVAEVITYTDRAITQVWKVIGSLFVLTVLIMCLLTFYYGRVDFSLMLPLSFFIAASVFPLPVWLSAAVW